MTLTRVEDPQVIDLTDGANEYTWPTILTELTGRDISADTVVMALGSKSAATTYQTWVTPDILTFGTISAKEYMLNNPSVPGVKIPDGVDPATVTLHWVSGQLMIGVVTVNHPAITPPAGSDVYPRIRIVDSSETVPRRGERIIIR